MQNCKNVQWVLIDGFVSNKVRIKKRERGEKKRQQNKKKKDKPALLRDYDFRKEKEY